MADYLTRPAFPPRPRKTEYDSYLSSDIDLELSVSSASLNLNSPPREHYMALTPDTEEPSAMDISPCPPPKPVMMTKPKLGRPRALTSSARLFGRDVSNDDVNTSGGSVFGDVKDTKLAPSPQITSSHIGSSRSDSLSAAKRLARPALPNQWFVPPAPSESEFSSPPLVSPIAEDVDAMDVDMYSDLPNPLEDAPPLSAAPTITSFNHLFFDSTSPRRSLDDSPSFSIGPKKKPRRSLSPESTASIRGTKTTIAEQLYPDVSSPLQESPLERKLHRTASSNLLSRFATAGASSKPMLQGLGAPNGLKRPRRPALSAMIDPSADSHMNSAPIVPTSRLYDPEAQPAGPSARLPNRRAFSAMLPPKMLNLPDNSFGSETSFDSMADASPAQAYAKRQQVKTIRRCDGTEDFRPLTGVTALVEQERGSPSSRELSVELSPATKLLRSAGLPGFGDNESHGKLLPCHRVREDGLMRINVKTLNDLLDNKFASCIETYIVIDCRFDYEYAGGHVPGAINMRSTAALEDFLLGDSLSKPKPSVSGDTTLKTVIIFHCEFSAKRAPTFAKHLRSKDRAMNGHVYPKILYPEVYVLEGGYCQYFSQSSQRCQPPGYIRMDDPEYAGACKAEMDIFRKLDGKDGVGKPAGARSKFGRHRSYAYGELATASSNGGFGRPTSLLPEPQMTSKQPVSKRNTAPSGVIGGGSLFAAANAARTRRGGINDKGLNTLQEHDLSAQNGETTDEEPDIGDSPCPPPNKAAGLFKNGKRLSGMPMKAPLTRAETYGPARMAY